LIDWLGNAVIGDRGEVDRGSGRDLSRLVGIHVSTKFFVKTVAELLFNLFQEQGWRIIGYRGSLN